MINPRKRLATLTVATLLSACGPRADDAGPDTEASPETQLPALSVAEAPLDRRALLMAIYEAGSARAAGASDIEAQRALDGKRFEVALRFGCAGDEMKSRRWTLDEGDRALRFRIEPEVGAANPLIEQLALPDTDSVLGFWITRPWLLDAACVGGPAASPQLDRAAEASTPGPSGVTASGEVSPRLAIVQFFSAQDPRTHLRSDRPLTATIRLPEGEPASVTGYDLLLSGRLARLPDGQVIACTIPGREMPPACAVSVKFDRIALTKPDGETITEWSAS